MGEITEQNIINVLKEQFPKFNPYWEAYISQYGDDGLLYIQILTFRDFVVDVIISKDESEIERIFNFVEFLMCESNDYVQNLTATGFLEGLILRDPDEIKFINFSHYLGKETIAYLRAWNKFCGIETEGI